MQRIVDGAVAGGSAPGRIGDPVLRVTIYGRNTFIADDKAANILALLFHVFLDIKYGMMVASQYCLVLQDSLGRW